MQQSDGGLFAIQDLLELIEQFGEGFSDDIGSSGVIIGKIVGRLPPLDHIIRAGVVG